MNNDKNNEGATEISLTAGLNLDGTIMMRCVSAAAIIVETEHGKMLHILHTLDLTVEEAMEHMRTHTPKTRSRQYHYKGEIRGIPAAVHVTRDVLGTQKPYMVITTIDGGGAGNYLNGPLMVTVDSSLKAVRRMNASIGTTVLVPPVREKGAAKHPQETAPGERKHHKVVVRDCTEKVRAAQAELKARQKAKRKAKRKLDNYMSNAFANR